MEFDNLLDEFDDVAVKPKSSVPKVKEVQKRPVSQKLPRAEQTSGDFRAAVTNPFFKAAERLDSDSDFSNMMQGLEDTPRSEKSVKSSQPSEVDDIQSIEAQIAAVKSSLASELEAQKAEFISENAKNLQTRKATLQETFELKKRMFEDELNELENLKKSYEKMQALTDSLGYNSSLLNKLSVKLNDTKEGEDYSKSTKLMQIEKNLEEREARILTKEQQLEREGLVLQESFENIVKAETEVRNRFESEQFKLKNEKEKLYSVFQMLSSQIQEKKQEVSKELHKIKLQQESLQRRKEQVKSGVASRLHELSDIEELLIQKHEETLKLINQERRQISEKREELEEKRKETKVFEEKLAQNSAIIERRELELNSEVEELIKTKNSIELSRSHLESEMQSLHQLSQKLHNQSENISRSKEQIEAEMIALSKQEEDVENMRVYSMHELVTAKDTWHQLEQQMKTFEKMSVSLIQDLTSDNY